MPAKRNINEEIKTFFKRISKKIKIDGIYLFGSYVKGTENRNSDVDLAVLSDEFEGIRFYDRAKISRIIIHETYPALDFADFEIHPYRTDEFTEDDPFVAEILKTGIKII